MTLAGLVLVGLAGCGGSAPELSEETGRWQPIADSPLGARDGAVSAWTGTELLVVGGADWWCPDDAACDGPAEDDHYRDGAAYDPATDTWRELPPVDLVLWHALGAWTGQELVVTSWSEDGGATGALDPAAGVWRELPPPPSPVDRVLWTGEQLVFWVGDDSYGADWTLDPATGEWSRLPEDPFGATFDRSYGWTGAELVLAAQPADDGYPGAFEVATLDPVSGQWDTWPTSPVTFWAQDWFVFQGAWVNATQTATVTDDSSPETVAGAADLATREWHDVPQATEDHEALTAACQLPPLGAAGSWLVAGGGALVSLDPPVATLVPACDPIVRPATAAWTGDELVVWGGVGPAGPTDAGLRWTPPPPG